MKSTGTRARSSTLSTPTWASPRAPPPDSTRPILGRWAVVSGAAEDGVAWERLLKISASRMTAKPRVAKPASFGAGVVHADAARFTAETLSYRRVNRLATRRADAFTRDRGS